MNELNTRCSINGGICLCFVIDVRGAVGMLASYVRSYNACCNCAAPSVLLINVKLVKY